MARILVGGVYLTDRPSTVDAAVAAFSASSQHEIVQRWIALGPAPERPVPHTVRHVDKRTPKYHLLNALFEDAALFDWVVACDDDVEFGEDFVDRFFALAERHDFALCQPARTRESYIDHAITAEIEGLSARRTRFVEIGPVTVLRHDAVRLLLPFTDIEGMGWGLDFIWPAIMEANGLRLGIVDGAPVHHRLRPSVVNYSYADAEARMNEVVAAVPHLSRAEAYRILETYP
ncbi:hypothetical protein GGR25_004737 [Kaistia hirudinis]|uniref:Glycosyltransferase n=1 Tax=Kaistia hirudinis TaxID=1293440 RepID=A0A840AVM0_9HYPH|nr:hypothetical protein [Kaistia hirudinis]MBB3933664.1 hypothetical protein [Kaistia hirudinis]